MHTPPERPQRVPFWQLVLYGASSMVRGADPSLPADVALHRSARHLRVVPLHLGDGRRDAGGGPGRLGVLLAAGGRGEAQGRRLPRPHDAAAGVGRPAAGPDVGQGRSAARDLVRRGRRARRRRDLCRATVRFDPAVPERVDPAGAVEGARDHEERPHDGLRPARGRPDAGERPAGAPGRDRRRDRRAHRVRVPEGLGVGGSDLSGRRRLRRIRPVEPAAAPPCSHRRGARHGGAARAHPGSGRARGRRGGPARGERVPALPAGVLAAGRRRAGVLVRGAGGGGHRGHVRRRRGGARGCPPPRGRKRW